MEVRCGQCSKLFRVADDRITGAGIRFKCTKCGEYITVTREDLENYKLSSGAAAVLDSFEPKPPKKTVPPSPPPPPPPPPAQEEPEPDEGFTAGTDEEGDIHVDFPVDESLFSEPTMQGAGHEEEPPGEEPTGDSFFAEPSFEESPQGATLEEQAYSGDAELFAEPPPQDGMDGVAAEQDASDDGEFFGSTEDDEVPAQEADSGAFSGFDIVEDHADEDSALSSPEEKDQESPSFLASPHEFGEEAVAGAPPIHSAGITSSEPQEAALVSQGTVPEQKTSGTVTPAEQAKPAVASPPHRQETPEAVLPQTSKSTIEKPEPAAPQKSSSEPLAPVQESPAQALSSLSGIHPLASGSIAGTLGGIGCAIPVGVMMFLGVGILSMVLGEQKTGISMTETLLMGGASLIGLAEVIGILLALFQARTERTIFGILGILLGGFISALLGSALGLAVAAGSGAILSTALITTAAVGWGIKGLLVSASVVLVRRIAYSSRTEMSSASISGGQLLVIGLALLILVLGVISEVRTAAGTRTAKEEAAKTIQNMLSAEGLQVASSLASWDPDNGDLLLNVTVENTTDEEKKPWYLTARVYNTSGNVLTTARMLTGRQLFRPEDYEALSRRGVNVQQFRMEQMKEKEVPLAPHAVISVELRVINPPEGVATFDALFETVDPSN